MNGTLFNTLQPLCAVYNLWLFVQVLFLSNWANFTILQLIDFRFLIYFSANFSFFSCFPPDFFVYVCVLHLRFFYASLSTLLSAFFYANFSLFLLH